MDSIDFHALNKKIDPKKLLFGSKIDKNDGEREEYYSVKEIISPELVKLSNGIIVHLIGVKENKIVNSKALEFLKLKTQKQKVFMKYDVKKYEENNHLLCYLYLKNKTFLNAHLIKNGFAQTDQSFNYKYKRKFLNLENSNNG